MLIDFHPRLNNSRVANLSHKKCEACGRKPARRHSPFCSQECAETFMYYD
jgi:predicted nucleic acid-binding Zn ribbon protein